MVGHGSVCQPAEPILGLGPFNCQFWVRISSFNVDESKLTQFVYICILTFRSDVAQSITFFPVVLNVPSVLPWSFSLLLIFCVIVVAFDQSLSKLWASKYFDLMLDHLSSNVFLHMLKVCYSTAAETWQARISSVITDKIRYTYVFCDPKAIC